MMFYKFKQSSKPSKAIKIYFNRPSIKLALVFVFIQIKGAVINRFVSKLLDVCVFVEDLR